ncbi:hypothetical protein BDV24DRAFT_146275 [Aspergillus arachidicola]|uniref:Uncharacterized protein n=1 Tax=Aspergillus arachidicola TaxID=656916 RepID=A0A5N6XLP9_9EURO|nr:hypothetical protein BDV24DRAFT_146275 [Aspergillus arachidicola]
MIPEEWMYLQRYYPGVGNRAPRKKKKEWRCVVPASGVEFYCNSREGDDDDSSSREMLTSWRIYFILLNLLFVSVLLYGLRIGWVHGGR